MRTKTRDTSEYGYRYLSGMLRMETERNMANIGRKTEVSEQNMQHFMSNSPWPARHLIEALQDDIGSYELFAEAVLVIDESADEKAGKHSAGAGRQHNGRLGKIELSQVGVFASLVTPEVHTWIDGDLFLQKHWFSDEYARQRQRVDIPSERSFQTKLELAWEIIQRVQNNGVPFVAVAIDTLYGRSFPLRARLDKADIEYYADVPVNTRVYLERPQVVHFPTKRGTPSKDPTVIGTRYQVCYLLDEPQLQWHKFTVRTTERGLLVADFARLPVWTVKGDQVRQEWLLIRRDPKRIIYTLSNARSDTPLEVMAWRKSHRYFVERDIQDAKSELGWDELQAIKFRAWEHQLALTIMASWFIALTRLDWAQRCERDPALFDYYQVELLPALSVGNVRELLRAVMPLPTLSPRQAAQLVVKHLINRTRSRKSRLRKALSP